MKKKKSISKLLKDAQKEFNRFIRDRDKYSGCISCGGSVDHAGHYFTVGQHSALRFDEVNCQGQCVSCNCYKHGNLIYYRKGLVKKYGELEVEALERRAIETPVKKWDRQSLEEIISTYKLKQAA